MSVKKIKKYMANNVKRTCASTIICVLLLTVISVSSAEQKGVLQKNVNDTIPYRWLSQSGHQVLIHRPGVFSEGGSGNSKAVIKVGLYETIGQHKAIFNHNLVVNDKGNRVNGMCRVEVTVPEDAKEDLLIYQVELKFDAPVRSDVQVEHVFEIDGKAATGVLLPGIKGYIKSYAISKEQPVQGYYLLGKKSASGGERLALPAVDIDLGKSLAIAADPFFGVGFHVEQIEIEKRQSTRVTVSSKYSGSLVPVTEEKRTIALQFHSGGADGMLSNFYHTVPDIEPGAAWIHDIHLNYFDYLSQDGEGWYKNLKKLAEVIPEEYRKNALVCIHGWYDYLGRYCYNEQTKQMDDEWNAFNLTDRQYKMSKADMHKRIIFAKDLGFHVALYFTDGISSDSGYPGYKKEWQGQNEEGQTFKCWIGPGVIAQTYAMDPANPEVKQWFLDRMESLLKEFGTEIDAMVWDETFHFGAGTLTKTPAGYAYADISKMIITAELSKVVQSWHKVNPALVLLTSDLLGTPYPTSHTALVAHGTFQDSGCNPDWWAGGMLNNYRNCLISCNWGPVKDAERNKIAAEKYGLPQGLSDGYGGYIGPAKMEEEMLGDVIKRFIANSKNKRQRTRYLLETKDQIRTEDAKKKKKYREHYPIEEWEKEVEMPIDQP